MVVMPAKGKTQIKNTPVALHVYLSPLSASDNLVRLPLLMAYWFHSRYFYSFVINLLIYREKKHP